MNPELAWTIASGIGLAISLVSAADSMADLRAVCGFENGRRILAKGGLRSEVIRGLIQSSWLYLGITTLGQPGQPEWSVTTIILVGTNIGVAINSAWSLRDRYIVRRMLT